MLHAQIACDRDTMHIPTLQHIPPMHRANICCCHSPLSPIIRHQPTFDVDPQALEKKYKRLQWQLHPDKAGSKTAVEQDYSAAQASQINQAYQILRHPLSRANYLVSHDYNQGHICIWY